MRVAFVLPYRNDGLEPLGILYLAAELRAAGHEVLALIPEEQVLQRALPAFRPHILAFSVITGWHRQYLALNRRLKASQPHGVLSVLGGPHATFFPTLIDEDGVDAICRGEGEQAFAEFVTKVERGEDYWRTRNWWVKHEGQVYRNPLRPEIQELDTIRFPDRTVLRAYPRYVNRNLRAFVASRGCPYDCPYCFNHAYRQLYSESGHPAHLRRRSVDNLITEICQVRENHGLRSVAFYDDVFVSEQGWLSEFAAKYSRQIGIPFECNLRVEQVTPDVVSSLRRAGCAIVALGIETGDENSRSLLLRRRYSNEQLARACALVREQGILLKTYNILGLPPGSIQRDWETLRLNVELRADIPTASVFQPYPGTELGDMAKREGYWSGDVDCISTGFYCTSPLKITDRAGIEVLQKLFFVGCRFPALLPLVRLIVAWADWTPLRHAVFWIYRCIESVGLEAARRIGCAEHVRRALLRMLTRKAARSDCA